MTTVNACETYTVPYLCTYKSVKPTQNYFKPSIQILPNSLQLKLLFRSSIGICRGENAQQVIKIINKTHFLYETKGCTCQTSTLITKALIMSKAKS